MPAIAFRNFEGIPSNGAVEDVSLDAIFSDDDHDLIEDDTDSDGFLSEVWKMVQFIVLSLVH